MARKLILVGQPQVTAQRGPATWIKFDQANDTYTLGTYTTFRNCSYIPPKLNISKYYVVPLEQLSITSIDTRKSTQSFRRYIASPTPWICRPKPSPLEEHGKASMKTSSKCAPNKKRRQTLLQYFLSTSHCILGHWTPSILKLHYDSPTKGNEAADR